MVPKEGVTPERAQRVLDKAGQVLDSEYGELLQVIVDLLYEHSITEQEPDASHSDGIAGRKRRSPRV